MGYCNFYGKVVSGDKASCIGGGGDWVEQQPSLMQDTDDFGQPVSTNFAGQSLFDINAQRQNILDKIEFADKAPSVMSEQYKRSLNYEGYDPSRWARENPGTAKVLGGVQSALEFADPTGDIKSALATIIDPDLRQAVIDKAYENPKLTFTGIIGVLASSKSKKIRNAANWFTKNRYKKAVKVGKKKKNIFGKADATKSKEAGQEVNVFGKSTYKNVPGAKNFQFPKDATRIGGAVYYGDKWFDELSQEPLMKAELEKRGINVDAPTTPTTKPTDKPNVFNGGKDADKKTQNIFNQNTAGTGGSTSAPPAADKKKKTVAEESWWDRVNTPYTKQSPWDTPFQRAMEMVTYMDSPVATRGADPRVNWRKTDNERANAAAIMEKARIAAQGKGGFVGKMSPKDVGNDIASRLKKDPWFTVAGVEVGSDYDDEELANLSNLGIAKFQYYYNTEPSTKGDYEKAMTKALEELRLGI